MSTLANSASDAEREQTRMLRDSAVDFVARFSDLKRLRVLRHQLPGFDTQIQRGMVESGWFALLVPEALGGFGGRFTDMAVLAEELGKGLIAEALIAPAVLVTRTLVHQAHSEACRLLLTRVMAGETHIALAWQSAAGGLSATGATVIARATETGVTLAGSSAFVVGAGAATAFIVVAHENGAPGLYLVDALQSGVTLAHAWRVDGTPITHLTLQDVAVKAEQRLAQGAKVALALSLAIDETRVMVAAELLGVMRAALDLTLGYLRTRVQFKQAIGSFQALQHRAVDQYIQLRLSAASIEAALRVLDQPQDTNQTD